MFIRNKMISFISYDTALQGHLISQYYTADFFCKLTALRQLYSFVNLCIIIPMQLSTTALRLNNEQNKNKRCILNSFEYCYFYSILFYFLYDYIIKVFLNFFKSFFMMFLNKYSSKSGYK